LGATLLVRSRHEKCTHAQADCPLVENLETTFCLNLPLFLATTTE